MLNGNTLYKFCHRCKMTKTEDSFNKNRSRKDGLQAYCKVCRPLYRRERIARNPIAYHNASRRHNLQACFKLSESAYEELLLKQDGVCAICKQKEKLVFNGRVTHLSVDHNHVTNAIRGLLCRRCNAVIGYLESSYGTLALNYLRARGSTI